MKQQYVIMQLEGVNSWAATVPAFYGKQPDSNGYVRAMRQGHVKHAAGRKSSLQAQIKAIAEDAAGAVVVQCAADCDITVGTYGSKGRVWNKTTRAMEYPADVTVVNAGTSTVYATAAEFAQALRAGEIAGLQIVWERAING